MEWIRRWRHVALLVGGLAVVGLATVLAPVASGYVPDPGTEASVDAPDGFTVDILASHSTFPDDVAAQFRFRYAEPGDSKGKNVVNAPQAGSVVAANVAWEPGGTSGWHTHPGPVIVAVTEGSVDVTNASDCVTRTYEAGEAFVDPGQGNVHVAENPGDQPAAATALFFGVPDGEPATVWAEPADC